MDDKVQAFYTIIKLTVAIVLFSHTLPHRERLGLRISFVAVGAALVSFAGFSSGFTMYPPLTDFSSYLIGILSFLAVLALMLVGQLTIYRNSLLCSLFCCSMAYSLENLSSEVERCVAMVFKFPSYPPPIVLGSLRYWIVSSVIFLVGNTVLIRRIEKSGLRQIDDPAMVLALVLAVMVNMIFDLIVKELGVSDIAVHFIVLLNVVYLSLCVFIMYAEFEIVYNRRLQIGIAAEIGAPEPGGELPALVGRAAGDAGEAQRRHREDGGNDGAAGDGGAAHDADANGSVRGHVRRTSGWTAGCAPGC